MGIERIALTGQPYSGKSTLARALAERGYYYINFTDVLKQYTVYALRACGIHTSVTAIHQGKRLFRPLLQELGTAISFDCDPRFVVEALTPWVEQKNRPNAVFDNVRTDAQFEVLKEFGFELVEVYVSRETQVRRAAQAGVRVGELDAVLSHSIEKGLSTPPHVILNGDNSPEQNIRFLLGDLELVSSTAK